MNFIKRAWLAIKAKKGRTVLLTLVTSAILIFVLAGLIIKNAADSAVKSAKSQTGSSVSLQINREYMMSQMTPPDQNSSSDTSSSSTSSTKKVSTTIPLSLAQKIAKKSGIASYLFTATTTVTAGDNISAISTSSSSSSSNNSSNQRGGGPQMVTGDFTITGVNETDKVSDFSSGTSKISKGSGITSSTEDNSAVISSDLAKANNLSVGDSFTVKATVNGTETSYTLKVVGIYKSSSTATSAQLQNNASNPQNNIYTTISTANTMKGESDTLDSAVFTLSNPAKMASFVKAVKKDIDTEKYSVVSSDEIYQQMLQPLNNISAIAKNIVILVAVAGSVILTLIIILSIRERRYEIGVLMSLGEQRLKIIGQFFMELFMVTLVSLCVATVAGNYVGNLLGNQLLSSSNSQQVSQQGGPDQGTRNQSNQSNQSDNSSSSRNADNKGPQGKPDGGNIGSMMSMAQSSKAVDKLNIKLGISDLAKLGGIALLISFVSTILASIGIIRMKPKDILSSN